MTDTSHIYQISELVTEMRNLLELSYPEIWVEGEISSLSTPASGHLYFTLKDENAQLRCAMFRSRASINRYKPKDGNLVRVRTKISVYPARGDMQAIVQYVEAAGEGLLQRRYEELKNKLNQQGLFDSSHKKALPSFSSHIGIITSPSGAAIQDVLTTLKRRCPGITVTIYPALVQGSEASLSIQTALQQAIKHNQADVLLLTRGGGSLEDLWCFNDEQLANVIFKCPIPLISAVGHEVDFTIADLVADFRAPTPTAAAEIISPNKIELLSNINKLGKSLKLSYDRKISYQSQRIDFTSQQLVHPRQRLANDRNKLRTCSDNLLKLTRRYLQEAQQKSERTKSSLINNLPSHTIQDKQQRLQTTTRALRHYQALKLERVNRQYSNISDQLDLVSPLATLKRGFSIVHDDNQQIVRNANELKEQQAISITLAQGNADCQVTKVYQDSNK